MYGAVGARIGSGAAKVGKKAAQSEAGRSAGRAAIKGAADGATKDLSDRYLHQGEYSTKRPPSPEPVRKQETNEPKEESHSSSELHKSSAFSGTYTTQTQYSTHHHKRSAFSKYKPRINLKSSSKTAAPRPRRQPRERIYKHRLAKDADWDRLPLAQALYNYKAEMKCDLEFRKGQVIQVITRTDNQFDWWEGKIEDHVGIFPANYVKLI